MSFGSISLYKVARELEGSMLIIAFAGVDAGGLHLHIRGSLLLVPGE